MVPYIAALIVLIVAILFAVYKRVDGFEIGTVSFTKDTLVKDFLAAMTAQLEQNKAVKKMIENVGEFDDNTLTVSKLNDLAIGYSTSSDGKITPSMKPISKALVLAIDREITTLEAQIDMMEKQITSGAIQLNQKISDAMKAAGGDVRPDYTQMSSMINQSIKVNNSREAYVKSKIPSTKASSASTTVGGVDAKDLFGAVGGVSQALKASTLTGDIESKEEAPLTTPGFTKEVEDRIAKSVATQLKDTLLSQRSTSNPAEDIACPYASYDSTATSQGQEYRQVKPAQPAPDMSEYIRKDSIPCWNCSLP